MSYSFICRIIEAMSSSNCLIFCPCPATLSWHLLSLESSALLSAVCKFSIESNIWRVERPISKKLSSYSFNVGKISVSSICVKSRIDLLFKTWSITKIIDIQIKRCSSLESAILTSRDVLLIKLNRTKCSQMYRILVVKGSADQAGLSSAFQSSFKWNLHNSRHILHLHFWVDWIFRWRNCTFKDYL